MTRNPSNLLRSLRSSIDAMLSAQGISAKVHSIQLLTSTGEALSNPISYFLSCEPETLEDCIKEFTRFDETTHVFTRSLASFEIEDQPFLANDIPSSRGATAAATSPANHQFRALDGWKFEDPGTSNGDTYDSWLTCLGQWFPGRGSTLWVTQRSTENEQSPKSSAFVIFSGVVERAPGLFFRISKLLRDALVTEIIAAYRDVVQEQQSIQATLLKKVLSESSSDMPLAPEILAQIQRYSRALASNLSILISGEAGTGKLAIAKEIHRRRETYLRAKGQASGVDHVENRVELVRVPTLADSAQEVDRKLHEALSSNGGASQGGPLVVLDDIQAATPIVQDALNRLLDEFLPGAPDLARGKIIFTTLPGLDSLVACGAFSASLYSQISAFELVCPPLRDRFANPDDMRAILNYTVRAISNALELPTIDLSATEIERIQQQHWPGNFRDLNNYLIRLLLYRSQ